jgi:hypothetical protein
MYKPTQYFKAGMLALALTVLFVIAWECYWRSNGFAISYNDDESLWAYARKQIYQSSPARPVIIGSSRIKFDLDLATWKSISGEEPIQLSLEGTNPRPLLADLARDTSFKGTVMIGVTEMLFFQPDHNHFEIQANKRIEKYPHWSLSEQESFRINRVLESNLVFLQENTFSANSLLKRLPIESRPGVFVFPNFPLKFAYTQLNRQTYLTDALVADTAIQAGVKDVWKKLAFNPIPATKGDTLTALIQSVKADIDKIKARGGDVVFIREPSGGPFREIEKSTYPRELYWDRLLKETETIGIHFEDYPETSNYTCPEWSHLAPADAKTYTQSLISIMEQKTGWKIKK